MDWDHLYGRALPRHRETSSKKGQRRLPRKDRTDDSNRPPKNQQPCFSC